MNFLYSSFIKTIIAIIVLVTIYLFIDLVFVRRIHSNRKRSKAKALTRNILVVVLVGFLAKIWVEGFGQFLALIGFISAALTITQKENLMNLFGWLIIMWRDTFAEGDYLAIKDTAGIVANIGFFYISLAEVTSGSLTNKTGRVTKIPNAYLSLYNFSIVELDNFIPLEKIYTFSFDSNIKKLNEFKQSLEEKFMQYMGDLAISYNSEEAKEYKRLQNKKRVETYYSVVGINNTAPRGYELRIKVIIPLKKERDILNWLDSEIIAVSAQGEVQLATFS